MSDMANAFAPILAVAPLYLLRIVSVKFPPGRLVNSLNLYGRERLKCSCTAATTLSRNFSKCSFLPSNSSTSSRVSSASVKQFKTEGSALYHAHHPLVGQNATGAREDDGAGGASLELTGSPVEMGSSFYCFEAFLLLELSGISSLGKASIAIWRRCASAGRVQFSCALNEHWTRYEPHSR
ncbi:hypothetical protein TNCT_132801 [Trichonephila clavata]|uniref:Uncharacterized protein n=1 Tax=Trichonephila clavata TaxID=2740835 RepID=A0A8X6LA95_TRICU|nr:hypothetical protein TNCT_132801 [Trichonephila clavata]